VLLTAHVRVGLHVEPPPQVAGPDLHLHRTPEIAEHVPQPPPQLLNPVAPAQPPVLVVSQTHAFARGAKSTSAPTAATVAAIDRTIPFVIGIHMIREESLNVQRSTNVVGLVMQPRLDFT